MSIIMLRLTICHVVSRNCDNEAEMIAYIIISTNRIIGQRPMVWQEFMARMRILNQILTIILILCFCGCSGASSSDETPGAPINTVLRKVETHMEIDEVYLPDPDVSLLAAWSDEAYVVELDRRLCDETVYRLAQVWDAKDGIIQTVGCFLQVLEPPYDEWNDRLLSSTEWDHSLEYEGFQLQARRIISIRDGEIYLEMDDYRDLDLPQKYVGKVSAVQLMLGGKFEISEGLNLELFLSDDGQVYGYSEYPSTNIYKSVGNSEPEKIMTDGKVHGLYVHGDGDALCWYGENDDGFCSYEVESGKAVFEDVEIATMPEYLRCRGGELYAVSTDGIYRVSSKEAEGIFDFYDQGYILTDILGFSVSEDGTYHVLAETEDEEMLLVLKEADGPAPEKKEIVVALGVENGALKDMAARFNRTSKEWRVVFRYPGARTDGMAFGEKIGIETALGNGPDLIAAGLLDMWTLAEGGYLEEVSDITDDGAFLPGALACGMTDGKQYGVPYESYLYFLACGDDIKAKNGQWTPEECMKHVKESGAGILQYGYSGMDIIRDYFLLGDSGTYIDFEKGKSHLDEEPFLEALAFAKEYADDGSIPKGDVGEALADGRIAAEGGVVTLDRINYLDSCFEGKADYCGFPCLKGNGCYIAVNQLYLSAASDVKEGAREFLSYMVSEEMQKRCAAHNSDAIKNGIVGHTYVYMMPVRQDALELMIRLKTAEKELERLANTPYGVEYQPRGIQKEKGELVISCALSAQPYLKKVWEVMPLFVEELEPYFQGQATAEDAAGKLDNRVQLYLDEHEG